MQKAFNMVFDYWVTLSPTPILPPIYDGMKYILDISKGFIRDTGPFFLIPIILGNLSKPRIFSILGLGCPYLFGIFYIWTWLSGTLGFPTWTTCPNPWDFCLLGEHWHLDFLSELFFFYGLCDRTGRPSIGQRKYSSRGSPLPTR